jgi:hypothetical protein
MTESTDPYSSKLMLSARGPSSPTPYSSSPSPRPEDSSRIEKLIRALRSKCQSLADGGSRFHEVFDAMDSKDSGEISGVNSVLAGLNSIGITNATKGDGEALIRAFEGSEPGRMSYRKFLKAVMLGQTKASNQRVAGVIEKLHWQLSDCEFEDVDFSHIQIIATYFGASDDDGGGVIPRNEVRREAFSIFLCLLVVVALSLSLPLLLSFSLSCICGL